MRKAEKRKKEGFISSKAKGNWCGSGIYFYDIKLKAWWSENPIAQTQTSIAAHNCR